MLMKSSKILTLAVTFALLASVMAPILGNGPVANAAADSHIDVKIGFLNPITGPLDDETSRDFTFIEDVSRICTSELLSCTALPKTKICRTKFMDGMVASAMVSAGIALMTAILVKLYMPGKTE